MKINWSILLASALMILFVSSAAYPVMSGVLSWLALASIFAGVPYLIYKSLPKNNLALVLSIASPLLIGPSLGYWSGFWANRILNNQGTITKGTVSAVWLTSARYKKRNSLYKVKFSTPSGTYETSVLKNVNSFREGDLLSIRYAPTNPNICQVVE